MRALLFDLYGVIMFTQSKTALADIEAAAQASGPEFWDAYWAERHNYDAGLLDGPAYWAKVGERLGRPIADVPAAVHADVVGWLNQDDDMVDYVMGLIDDGVNVGLLSNIPIELTDVMLARNDWLARFDPLVLSCRTGLAKPEGAIFDLAVERLGTQPADVLFIDDMAHNVEGAEAQGLVGHIFTGRATLEPVVAAHLAGN